MPYENTMKKNCSKSKIDWHGFELVIFVSV
ncbi:hypothetical protein X747_12430 [Mesorhizobium sp. LNJC384A00]|nr:hypothetical protein X747_12430 [Mesorhizobium sp. LNJC384A00]